MPRYYFHLRDGKDVPDEEGALLPDLTSARREAMRLAGGLLNDAAHAEWKSDEWSMKVEDETGRPLFTFVFSAQPQAGRSARA